MIVSEKERDRLTDKKKNRSKTYILNARDIHICIYPIYYVYI